MIGVVGVVPVTSGFAFAQLRGRTLLSRALGEIAGLADRVVVVAGADLVDRVRGVVEAAGVDAAVVEIDSALGPVGARVALDLADVERLVLHDPRCPLLPAAEIARLLALDREAAVGVRPVTDTVKTVEERGGVLFVAATLDRAELRSVCSPLVISGRAAGVLAAAVGPAWWTVDLWELVAALRARLEVDLVEVSSLGRRVDDVGGLWLLEHAEPEAG